MLKSHIAALFCILGSTAFSQPITITEARALSEGIEVTVSGTVTNGGELGIIRYFQDQTGGIAAYGPDVESIERGDSITLTGILTVYNGLLEITPITTFINHGLASAEIVPQTITAVEINEETESELVRLEQATFAEGGSSFVGNTAYNFTTSLGGGTIYVRNDHPLIGSLIPNGPVDLSGLTSQFSFTGFGGYQLILRDADDIFNPNPINITSPIAMENQSTDGFTLHWTTDMAATSEAYLTDDIVGNGLEEVHLFLDENSTEHSLDFSGLNPGEVYFVHVFSVADQDTAFSNVAAFATVSPTGSMKVYFNNSVNVDVANPTTNEAIQTNLKDTLVSFINRARSTLDLAIYNTNNSEIVSAVNDAYDRGVAVRYIAEGQNANSGLGSLIDDIPILIRSNSDGSGMHNKFVVVDYEDSDSSYVLTGSVNFTNNNLFTDANNLVVIQDKALAKAYRIEFNEMWGGDDLNADLGNSRFGELKVNNTPQKFIIDGKAVELYFSPSDNTTTAIAEAIETTEYDLEFALLLITNNILADAIVDAANLFVQPRGLLEDVNGTGSDFPYLLDEGINVIEHDGFGQLHHKYAIIDHSQPDADPIVITGSHNWTSSAESVNDENTLIIHDASIANQFYQEFTARYNEIVLSTNQRVPSKLLLFPNPATEEVTLEFDGGGTEAVISIFSLDGKVISQKNINSVNGANTLVLDVSNLPAGLYFLQYNEGTRSGVQRLAISE